MHEPDPACAQRLFLCAKKVAAYTIRMPQPCMLRLHKLSIVWRDDATMKLAIFP